MQRDPIALIRVVEVKEIIEAPSPVVLDGQLVEDYLHAPDPRQEEILRFLISVALDGDQPDVVRQNSYNALRALTSSTRQSVRVEVARHFQQRLGRRTPDEIEARVATAAGVSAYLRRAQRLEFFKDFYETMEGIGYSFRANEEHGQLLRTLGEVGGLEAAPPPVRQKIIKWVTRAYMGEPGGYGTWGQNRKVFYSNSAAALIEELLYDSRDAVREDLQALREDKDVKRASRDENVARRYEQLLDVVAE